MGKPLDLTNQRFGDLIALRRLDEKKVEFFYGNVNAIVVIFVKFQLAL